MKREFDDETTSWVRKAKDEGRDALDIRSYNFLCLEEKLRELEQSSVSRCLRAHKQSLRDRT